MDNPRVVITGLGIVSPNSGLGRAAFSEAIFSGASGIRPVSLFDTAEFKAKCAGEIKDFSPESVLGKEGLRTQDRSTKLLACATSLSMQDANLTINEENSRDTGIAVGNTLGSLKSICDFDNTALKEGPQYVNPSLFPNTVINAQASHVSIRFNIKGFNATISTGFTAGLDAIAYAANFVRLGRKRTVLAGGVEELNLQTFIGFYRSGCLAGLNEGLPELSCPFDKRRNGLILGEGAAVVVLEELNAALKRNARIYAEVKGFGMSLGNKAQGLKGAMQLALKRSGMKPEDIDYISAAANSSREQDAQESEAIKEIFPDRIMVSALKSMTGDCYSASGAFQAVAALCSIEKQMIPPTVNYQEPDPLCDLNVVSGQARNTNIKNVLINCSGKDGSSSSLVISRFS